MAVGVIILLETIRPALDTRDSARTTADTEITPERMREALIERIAAENAGLASEPRAIRAPGPNSATTHRPQVSPPAPPEGYNFVPPPAQMAIESLPESAPRKRREPDNYPAWFDAPNTADTLADQAAAAGRDWTFGWIRLANEARADEVQMPLNALGGELLGASGNLLRARLPGEPALLRQIEVLPMVAGLGATPKAVKLPDSVTRQALALTTGKQLPVFITLMEQDPDDRWRQALQDLGATVGRFDADIRTYTAAANAASLDAIAEADFVLAIEAVALVEVAHDSAIPAMGADALRTHTGSKGLFSGIGGASVPIGVLDTGLNINHLDIASNRASVCGANFVWLDPRQSDADLWYDEHGHGTHVTGTIAGNGYVEPELAGMAPSISHIRFGKVLHQEGFGYTDMIQQGMDYLSQASGCDEDGSQSNLAKPLIVNMSLSAASNVFEGRGVGERKLDSQVWTQRQLYVVSQDNVASQAFSNFGTAKNSLSVGAVLDGGELAIFSSHGPTADGRLAPQVVATGIDVTSAEGAGSRDAYQNFSGTSMASPAVAGVAALLMDAMPEHREQPALTRARLMASAVRPALWLGNPKRFPASNSQGPGELQNQYGLGMASARTSVLNRDRADGWVNGSAISELEVGDLAWHDIEVPPDASQLVLVMTWDEAPTDTIANAVLNDLDLYLDLNADCGAGACGEYQSVSRKDNVEWIIVHNPSPGVHRATIVADRVYTEAPRAALAWTIIRGASTPSLQIEADKESLEQAGEVTLRVTADAYVAAGTRLQAACRNVEGVPCDSFAWNLAELEVAREDGLRREVDWSEFSAPLITLGEIAAGETQELTFNLQYRGSGEARIYFTATAWNARAASTSLPIVAAGSTTTEIAPVQRPANADFASATKLTVNPQKLDLLLAGTEPGEPVSTPRFSYPRRPSNSVWYDWSPPADGFYSFSVKPDLDETDVDYFDGDFRVELFRGDTLADIERGMPGSSAATEFFAQASVNYKLRVGHVGYRMPPVILAWSQSSPSNDAFKISIELEGAEGSIQGGNQGATLEAGELFGELAATVWYRWAAPEDGDWRFSTGVSDLSILAFHGERPADLRLVSGFPSSSIRFPAKSGRQYYIAVASENAFVGGESFELSWERRNRRAGNDDFRNAQSIGGRRVFVGGCRNQPDGNSRTR